MVVEGTIDRVSQPDFSSWITALTAAQVDAQQAAVRSFMEEIMENLPVVEWRPVALAISMPTSLLQSLFATQVPYPTQSSLTR